MTREEAKELLLHILMTYEPKDQYGDYDDQEPYEQAIEMAIEALSSDMVEVTDKSLESLIKGLEILGDTENRADAVEVVRCKDCKFWHSNTEFCDVWSHANFIAQRTLADDYCSLAERKGGDE